MSNLSKTYDRIAEDWHKDHLSDDWWQEGVDKFLSHLKRGSLIIDVGCAGGVKSKYMVERGMKVTGIDISSEFIKLAKKYSPEGEFIKLDMKDILEIGTEVDAIFAQASMLHLKKSEISGVLEKFYKVLNNNGIIYVSLKETKNGRPEEETRTEDDYGYPYSRHFSYFSKEEFENYLKDAGFKEVDFWSLQAGNTNWLQFVYKK